MAAREDRSDGFFLFGSRRPGCQRQGQTWTEESFGGPQKGHQCCVDGSVECVDHTASSAFSSPGCVGKCSSKAKACRSCWRAFLWQQKQAAGSVRRSSFRGGPYVANVKSFASSWASSSYTKMGQTPAAAKNMAPPEESNALLVSSANLEQQDPGSIVNALAQQSSALTALVALTLLSMEEIP